MNEINQLAYTSFSTDTLPSKSTSPPSGALSGVSTPVPQPLPMQVMMQQAFFQHLYQLQLANKFLFPASAGVPPIPQTAISGHPIRGYPVTPVSFPQQQFGALGFPTQLGQPLVIDPRCPRCGDVLTSGSAKSHLAFERKTAARRVKECSDCDAGAESEGRQPPRKELEAIRRRYDERQMVRRAQPMRSVVSDIDPEKKPIDPAVAMEFIPVTN